MSMKLLERRGISAAEAMIAVVIMGAVIVPLVGLLVQERTATVRGHLSFVAYLAAREEIGDIRFRLAAGTDPAALAHDWSALKGSSFKRLADAMTGGDPGIAYQAAQERIETKVAFQEDAGGLKVGKVSVRYGDGSQDFSFGVRKPGPVAP